MYVCKYILHECRSVSGRPWWFPGSTLQPGFFPGHWKTVSMETSAAGEWTNLTKNSPIWWWLVIGGYNRKWVVVVWTYMSLTLRIITIIFLIAPTISVSTMIYNLSYSVTCASLNNLTPFHKQHRIPYNAHPYFEDAVQIIWTDIFAKNSDKQWCEWGQSSLQQQCWALYCLYSMWRYRETVVCQLTQHRKWNQSCINVYMRQIHGTHTYNYTVQAQYTHLFRS